MKGIKSNISAEKEKKKKGEKNVFLLVHAPPACIWV